MERNMTVITVCPFCFSSHGIDVNSDDYIRWMDGVNAQDAFPYLNSNEREAIISGTCPSCWDKMFFNYNEISITEIKGDDDYNATDEPTYYDDGDTCGYE